MKVIFPIAALYQHGDTDKVERNAKHGSEPQPQSAPCPCPWCHADTEGYHISQDAQKRAESWAVIITAAAGCATAAFALWSLQSFRWASDHQLRAYVGFDCLEWHGSDLRASIKNFGSTPAFNLRVGLAGYSREWSTADIAGVNLPGATPDTLFPGQSRSIPVGSEPYISGKIVYDALGTERVTTLQIRVVDGKPVTCKDGNTAT